MRLLSSVASGSPELGHMRPAQFPELQMLAATHGIAPAPEQAARPSVAAAQVPVLPEANPRPESCTQ